jgi:hypothetical protein
MAVDVQPGQATRPVGSAVAKIKPEIKRLEEDCIHYGKPHFNAGAIRPNRG